MCAVPLQWVATSNQFGLLTGELECKISSRGRGKRTALLEIKKEIGRRSLGGHWLVVLSYLNGKPAGRYTIKV